MFPKIYVDMDGVLAGLYSEIYRKYGVNWHEVSREEYTEILREQHVNYRIFRNLKKTTFADTMLMKIRQLFGGYSILSTPFDLYEEECKHDKLIWIEKNLSIIPDEIIFTKEKFNYADGNILIDDYGPNLQKWLAAGGVGIKCKETSQKHELDHVVRELEKIYFDIMEIA